MDSDTKILKGAEEDIHMAKAIITYTIYFMILIMFHLVVFPLLLIYRL